MQLTTDRHSRVLRERRGVVLLSVLIVVMLMALAAYQFTDLMSSEYLAADSYARTTEVKVFADAGVQYVAAAVSDPNFFTTGQNGNPWENPTLFQKRPVGTAQGAQRQGYFTISSLRYPEDADGGTPTRFGLTDEGGKLNLNALIALAGSDTTRVNMLKQLGPTMTDDIANSILNWIDSSASVRASGAKDSDYSNQDPGYHCKSGPLDSLDELLLVQGVTPQLLYGNDRTRIGTADAADGPIDMGWQQYLTIYSREPNVDSGGNPRIYLNDTDLNNLQTKMQQAGFNDDLIQFIVAYRLFGPSASGSGGASGGSGAASRPTPFAPLTGGERQTVSSQLTTMRSQSRQKSLTSIRSLFDLTAARVSMPVQNGPRVTMQTIPNPLSSDTGQSQMLPMLFDKTTMSQASDLTPRINVNTASKIVLSMLPNLQDADVQAIISARPPTNSQDPLDDSFKTPAWLLTKAKLPGKTLSGLESYITARSSVYRFQVRGYYDEQGMTARVEAVVDANNGRPRVMYYRNLLELGKGVGP